MVIPNVVKDIHIESPFDQIELELEAANCGKVNPPESPNAASDSRTLAKESIDLYYENLESPDALVVHDNGDDTCTREKPWHRILVSLLARGMTQGACATLLGKSGAHVTLVTKRPWFQAQLTEALRAAGKSIITIAESESFNSLQTLIDLRDNEKVPASARITCAKEIIERAHGKAIQRIETANVTPMNAIEEEKLLEEQLRALRTPSRS